MADLATVAELCHGLSDSLLGQTLSPEQRLTQWQRICTDTRALRPGDVFLALVGERFDGHRFVDKALDQGAIAAIVRQGAIDSRPGLIEVADTLTAYQTIGRWWRQRLGLSVVAITGSVGKTTTKELIAAALAVHGPVHRTRANFNNEIGVPKTLLEMDAHHRYGVVEMGMRGPGEIVQLAQIAQPDVAVITNVGTAHIGRLGSRQAIANAKCELLAELPKHGTAVLNCDNQRLMDTAAGVWSGKTITYGLQGGDVRGTLLSADTLQVEDKILPLPLEGEHNALNYLGAIATLQALGLDWSFLTRGLPLEMPPGRASRHILPGDILLLDETYNAGAESMAAALRLLKAQPGSRHIAVLGTMKELGQQSIELHRTVGQLVKSLELDQLLVLADPDEATALVEGAQGVTSQKFSDHDRLADYLRKTMEPGDRLLFKASRSVAMDRVVEQLIAS